MLNQSLREHVLDFVNDKRSYFEQWIFDKPIVISKSQHEALVNLQRIMYKVITYFVNNYSDYRELMPVSQKAEKIINLFSEIPYRPGTYRTDFVYDHKGQVKIIEITSRFSLNTVFETAVFDQVARDFAEKNLNEYQFDRSYELIFDYLEKFYSSSEEILILKGSDLRTGSKIFKGILEAAGNKVTEVQFENISAYENRLEKAWIISELTLEEIETLPNNILKKLSESNLINDFRTAFLIHDKRFFSILGNDKLLNSALSLYEINELIRFYVPTFTFGERPDQWAKARENKDEWILKHRALGKSQSLYAGIVISGKDWDNLFESNEISEFVIQKWIPQRSYKGSLKGIEYNDYITGTLLFFNNNYFGLGPYRASSFPVTNVVDDRKVGGLALVRNDTPSKENVFHFFK